MALLRWMKYFRPPERVPLSTTLVTKGLQIATCCSNITYAPAGHDIFFSGFGRSSQPSLILLRKTQSRHWATTGKHTPTQPFPVSLQGYSHPNSASTQLASCYTTLSDKRGEAGLLHRALSMYFSLRVVRDYWSQRSTVSAIKIAPRGENCWF